MEQDADLFGKTFDQQVRAAGGDIEARDIVPNRRVAAEIVFEPMGARIRVTAYDANNQILFQRDDKKTEKNIAPCRVKGEVVFEPMLTGVRVTARDADHKLLWGYVGGKENVSQVHCLVAVYDTLQKMLADELAKKGVVVAEKTDPIEEAKRSLADLQYSLDKLRDCVLVQKREDATDNRARHITRIVRDANTMINLELSTLGPLAQMSKDRAVEVAQRVYASSLFEFLDGAPPEDWSKKEKEEWTKKCWFILVGPKECQGSPRPSRLLGIAKKDGEVLYDSVGGLRKSSCSSA